MSEKKILRMKRLAGVAVALVCLLPSVTFGQISTGEVTGAEINTLQSAVPFLTIAPDSRAGAMGDVGVATSPDINSQHWNAAKYVFMEGNGGMAISYTPWLRKLVPDINLAYLAGYYKLDGQQALSASLRYFSLGNIVFTDRFGNPDGRQFNPNEFALDAGYSRLFTDNLSGAITFRFIRSDLTGGQYVGDLESKAGVSVAADLGFYYTNEIDVSGRDANLSFGANISNIGTKISYTANQDKAFIPINLRLGSALKMDLDPYNSFTFALDLNKLLIPTQPLYADTDTAEIILKGKDPNVSVPLGMLQSFYDAPGIDNPRGSVFLEELHEITYSLGVEYWYREQFAIRGGYFYEYQTKGNRKYFTLGVGLKLNVFSLDFAYLIPTAVNNPLANTLRFTLGFNFDKFR
ncbi:MAG TPA: type IX secretion system outer membrane channel protein PorV [Bacteroidales bacterium]|nr:type IX secretion system outer membrane channel protein PorV [Bacteroidales bacterium]